MMHYGVKDRLDIVGKRQKTRNGKVNNDNKSDWILSYRLFLDLFVIYGMLLYTLTK